MANAVIEFSWDHGAIGKGSVRYDLSSKGGNMFTLRPEDEGSFKFRSGAPPNGIVLPKEGKFVPILPYDGYFENVRLESANHTEAMFHVTYWAITSRRDDSDDDYHPVLMYQRWVPITGGPVPAYKVKLRKIG